MGIGFSIFLFVVGAILTFAVDVSTQGFNLDTVGIISPTSAWWKSAASSVIYPDSLASPAGHNPVAPFTLRRGRDPGALRFPDEPGRGVRLQVTSFSTAVDSLRDCP